VLNGGPGRI